MKDMPFLARSCSPSQTPIYPKAAPIPDPRQLLPNTTHIKPSLSPNQRYKSTPCKSPPTHISNTASIRKHYSAKATARNKPTRPDNHNQKHTYSKSPLDHSPHIICRAELLPCESCQLNTSFRPVSKMSVQGNPMGQTGQSQLDQALALAARNLGPQTIGSMIRHSDPPKKNLQHVVK